MCIVLKYSVHCTKVQFSGLQYAFVSVNSKVTCNLQSYILILIYSLLHAGCPCAHHVGRY